MPHPASLKCIYFFKVKETSTVGAEVTKADWDSDTKKMLAALKK